MAGPLRPDGTDHRVRRFAAHEHTRILPRRHGAYRRPPRRQRGARRERGEQRVILAAGEHPGHRVDTEGRAHLLQRPGRFQARLHERGAVEVDHDPAVVRDVSGVGQEAVADVTHRRGTRIRRRRSRRIGRGGTTVPRHSGQRAREPAPQHRPPARRPPAPPPPPAPRGRPAGATTSPARAPDRSTGARPPRSPRAVTDRTTAALSGAEATRSPPTTAAPSGAHSAARPAATPSSQLVWVSEGHASPTSSAVAVPPIAAMAARFAAAALWPRSSADDQSRRKCRPSTRTSVLATTRPSEVPSTAASSPGPTCAVRAVPAWASTRAITPNSPTTRTLSLGSLRGTRGRGRVTCPILPLR